MRVDTDRRRFLRSLVAGSLAFTNLSFNKTNQRPLLSFATLGCPDWTYRQIVSFAAKYKYDGIEFRGLQREFDLTKTNTFGSAGNTRDALNLAKDNNIKIVCLGSSAVLHHSNTIQRKKNLDEAKRFVDLAHKLECPFVRVFPDKFIDGRERSIELIAEGMRNLAGFANGSDIQILLSTHGDASDADAVCDIFRHVPDKNAGIGWDILNTWYENRKEAPSAVYGKLKQYTRLVHVKDMSFKDGKETNVLLGTGEVPVFEGIDALRNGGYTGFYSFVWEKRWFPGIEEPEISFPQYVDVMNRHFSDK
ncbi:MAG: sugar phosphate isomerase/epimerase [Chitinophagaceae bacterium]|nr:sugar phosphate isomerase/epimerase [Chitinophagaceae bacterium]